MSFFVGKNENEVDRLLSADTLMKADPDYYRGRFEAIADLRHEDDGSLHRGSEFRRVASFVNVPLFLAIKMAKPDFFRDKREFYRFLDRHPEYLTYDRRNGGRGTAKDDLRMPLSALGIDYPGGPEAAEGWEPVTVPFMSSSEIAAEDAVDPANYAGETDAAGVGASEQPENA